MNNKIQSDAPSPTQEHQGPWAFFRLQDDGSWVCAIAAKTARAFPNAEVIDFAQFATQDEASAWASQYIGPSPERVYTAPRAQQ